MKLRLKSLTLPQGNALLITVGVICMLKFLIFDAIWCADTTFTPFSTLSLWLTTLLQASVLMIPLVYFRMWKTQTVILFLIDALLLSNLWYFRTYSSAIPLKSYLLAGNLSDFTASVFASMRRVDLLLPLGSVAALVILRLRHNSLPRLQRKVKIIYGSAVGAVMLALTIMIQLGGSFVNTIRNMRRNAYLFASVVPCYSVPGSLLYDFLVANRTMTEADRRRIEAFLSGQPQPYAIDAEPPTSVVLVLVESLESWVIGAEVEGQEITPNLNRMVTDSSTFYAPNVLTQVRAGRSIDGQLIYLTGLLPMLNGVYSTEFPDNTYPSIPRALAAARPTKSYLFTADKIQTWNQKDMARNIGIDRCFARPDYRMEESSGKHKRVGDRPFVRQTIELIEKNGLWGPGQNIYMQLVTFSTHDPFEIADELKTVRFSSAVPTVMANYMTAARYTDSALGELIDYLRKRSDWDRTILVIVGDHEGLASHRAEIRRSDTGARTVSAEKFTPLIVLNSPVTGRYDGVLGQIDVYPTLMSLFGTTSYPWQGLGQSILDPSRPDVAVGSHMEVVAGKDFDPSSPEGSRVVERLKDANDISDMMITFDYLKNYK